MHTSASPSASFLSKLLPLPSKRQLAIKLSENKTARNVTHTRYLIILWIISPLLNIKPLFKNCNFRLYTTHKNIIKSPHKNIDSSP